MSRMHLFTLIESIYSHILVHLILLPRVKLSCATKTQAAVGETTLVHSYLQRVRDNWP